MFTRSHSGLTMSTCRTISAKTFRWIAIKQFDATLKNAKVSQHNRQHYRFSNDLNIFLVIVFYISAHSSSLMSKWRLRMTFRRLFPVIKRKKPYNERDPKMSWRSSAMSNFVLQNWSVCWQHLLCWGDAVQRYWINLTIHRGDPRDPGICLAECQLLTLNFRGTFQPSPSIKFAFLSFAFLSSNKFPWFQILL